MGLLEAKPASKYYENARNNKSRNIVNLKKSMMPNRSWNWSFRKTGYSERQKQIDVWVKQYVIDRLIDLVVRYELYLSHKNKIQ